LDPEELITFLARFLAAKEGQPPFVRQLLVDLGNVNVENPLKTQVKGKIKDLIKGLTDQPAPDHVQVVLDGKKVIADLEAKFKTDVGGLPFDGPVTETLKKFYVNVQLLKSRATFLKNLAGIGNAGAATDWGRGRVDAFGSVRFLFFDPKGSPPTSPVSY